jgi:general secretion pathway protein L
MLVLFLAPHGRATGAGGWLLVENNVVAARGAGAEPFPTATVTTVVAVVPGEDVALHWLDLPAGLAPAQAQAAARHLAAEAVAQPQGDMHVAVGRETEVGVLRPVAIAPVAAMERWLETAAALGFDPEILIPDTALLPVPEEGFTRFDRDDVTLWRGPEAAFALEPDLAELVVENAPVAALDYDAFEAALPAGLERPLVNLRQGPFARRRAWRLQAPRWRRLLILALCLALVTLVLHIAQIAAYTLAADRAEEETRQIAAAALSRSPGSAGANDLGRRLAELRGGGVGFGAISGAVFSAVQAVPNVELSSFAFTGEGSVRLSARADTPVALADVASRIEAAGFAVDRMPPRIMDGRQIQDMIVRPR